MTILFSALMDASGTCSHLAAARMDSRWRCRSWYASRIFTGELQDLALPSSTLCHAMKGMLEWCAPDDCFLCWDRSEALLLKRFFPEREIFCMTGLPQSMALPQLRDLACFVGYPPRPERNALENLEMLFQVLHARFALVSEFRIHAEKIAQPFSGTAV